MHRHHRALALVYAATGAILLFDCANAHAICAAAAGIVYALMGGHRPADAPPPPPDPETGI